MVSRGGKHWAQRNWAWLRRVLRDGGLGQADRAVFGEYLALLEYKISRREDLDEQIEKLALSPLYKPAVDRLRCFRGISTIAAMTLATEIGDWRRFERPGQPVTELGPGPRAHSSGAGERRGPITKAGTSR